MYATEQQSQAAPPAAIVEPKVAAPHPLVGRVVLYWREVNSVSKEIGALPAIITAPTRASDGFDITFFRNGQIQGRTQVKFSDVPKAGCFTWGPEGPPRGKPGRPRKVQGAVPESFDNDDAADAPDAE